MKSIWIKTIFIFALPLILSGCMGEAIENVEERERLEALKLTAPEISSVSPAYSDLTGGGVLTVTGKRLDKVTSLNLGIDGCVITASSALSLTCTIPSASAGSVSVSAINDVGESGSLSNGFDYLGAPTVTLVSDAAGPVAGGNTVIISGTGFYNIADITFDSISCSSPIQISNTQATCSPLGHIAGSVDVVVTNIDTQTSGISGNGAYSYLDPETITNITSTTVNGSYKSTDVISIDVTFSGNITTLNSSLTLDTNVQASYSSGSGTNIITYLVAIDAGQNSAALDVTAFNIGDAVETTSLLAPDVSLPAGFNLADNKAIVVDTVSPTIVGVTSPSPDATAYSSGTIDIVVTLSETLNGDATTTSLTLFNSATAIYLSGTNPITYRYTIASENSFDLNVQSFNTGTATDIAGNPISSNIPAGTNLADNKNLIIDTTAPTLISITGANPGDGYYNAGEVIDITLNFNEVVQASTSTITLDTGTVVNLSSGSTTSSLVFQYTVAAETSSNLAVTTFTPGDATDAVSNVVPATLPLGGNLSDTQDIVIDVTGPSITSITSTTADATYGTGSTISIDVLFSEPVIASSPTLTLATTTTPATAVYASGSGSNTLTFTYTIAATENSTDLNISALNVGDALDRAGNTIVTALPGANNLANNSEIVIDTTPPTVSYISSTEADATYPEAAVLLIQVEFSEAVDVVTTSGIPSLALDSGGSAIYTSGTGTTTLVFTYTVATTENSSALDYNTTSSLVLNLGTIKDTIGNDADLTLATPNAVNSISDNQAIVIDTTAPTVSNVTSTTTDGTYGVPTSIDIVVTFDEAVDIVTTGGTPSITLNSGGTATYASGTGTAALTFNYVVAATENAAALDYTATSSLILNSGTIKDTIGNDADLTLAAPNAVNSISDNQFILIDTTSPTISDVTSTTGDGTYPATTSIDIVVTFDEAVDVVTAGGTPSIALDGGGSATYASGTGTTALTFTYVVAAENSTSLDYTTTTALVLNGGTILDAVSNAADLTLASPGDVNSISDNQAIAIDTILPTVSGVTVSNSDGDYGLTSVITVRVEFSEVVNVLTGGGTPTIALDSTGVATYATGTGTTTLDFTYTVAGVEASADLDYLATTSLALNGGVIDDVATNIATLTLAAPAAAGSISDNQAIVIDTTASTVVEVTSTSADLIYGAGTIIPIEIQFDETVVVDIAGGTPSLDLNATGGSNATYTSGSGTNVLTFNYTILAGHTTGALDFDATTSLNLNAGTIKDEGGNNATLTLAIPGAVNSIADNQTIGIDTTQPIVLSAISTDADATYGIGNSITIEIQFSEVVDVVTSGGTPTLALNSGGNATYNSGTGTDTLVFIYNIANPDTAALLDYTATTSLDLNSGTIKDTIGNDAVLTLATPTTANSISDNQSIVIETTLPTVANVISTLADGDYRDGQAVVIQVTFDEVVNVVTTGGTPSIALNSGGTATYASGTGTLTLNFNYSVTGTDSATDLDYTGTTSLVLNSGTVKDVNGNDADLTLAAPNAANSISDNQAIVIDNTAPTITSITAASPGNGTYTTGQVIDIVVTFNEDVTTSTSSLTLNNTVVVGSPSPSATLSSTITYQYTVASGEGIALLDVSSITIGDTTDEAGNTLDGTPPAGSNLATTQSITLDILTPVITSISPEGGQNTGGTQVTIIGTGFDPLIPSSGIQIGGQNCTVNSASSTQIICTTTVFAYTTGFSNVVVTNPNTENDTLNNGFLFTDPITITSISQSSGPTATATNITITGSGFALGIAVKIGTYSCDDVVVGSATSVSCNTSAGAAGTYDVTIIQNKQEKSLASAFTYVDGPVLAWQETGTVQWPSTSTNDPIIFNLDNIGTSDTSIVSISLTGVDSAYWSIGTDNCVGTVIANGSPCTVEVIFLGQFTPTGTYTGAVLNATATSGGSTTVNLEGIRAP
jgi:hypothetical protein